jgi:hypothetical protein
MESYGKVTVYREPIGKESADEQSITVISIALYQLVLSSL